ncbi:hypothetical protein ABPG75_005152 [Micractinium tetrahymenae]
MLMVLRLAEASLILGPVRIELHSPRAIKMRALGILAAEWHRLQTDPPRRNYDLFADLDYRACCMGVWAWGPLLAWKTAHAEGKPGLALQCAAGHVLLMAAAMLMMRRRWLLYLRWREVVGFAVNLSAAWAGTHLVVNGGLGQLGRMPPGSRPLRLFILLLFANSCYWIVTHSVHGCVLLRFVRLSQPLLVLPPLLSGRHICGHLLQDEAATQPLHRLYDSMATLHSVVLSLPLPPSLQRAPRPMEQCLALNCWPLLVLRVAPPLQYGCAGCKGAAAGAGP